MLLATKISIPLNRADLIQRPGLIQRLDDGLLPGGRLLLVCSPPGFGKTTLLSEWISSKVLANRSNSSRYLAAWLTLDEGENDPDQFAAYVSAAILAADPSFGEIAFQPLAFTAHARPEADFSLKTFFTLLINRLSRYPKPLLLVLDDFHQLTADSILTSLCFLIENLPARHRLIISGRSEPKLPLPRLRARNQLVELRVEDLRFTPQETLDFLHRTMRLNLADPEAEALYRATEGWVTGLQLAALAIRSPLQSALGRNTHFDVHVFLAGFAESNRYLLDYLVEEVLLRQPTEIQRFLLYTSILDRICASLCATILQAKPEESSSDQVAQAQLILERLEAGNLFVLPLDQGRAWYRYHTLFAEFLRGCLRRGISSRKVCADLNQLHLKASKWYEASGLPDEAIQYAILALDFETAARLIEHSGRFLLAPEKMRRMMVWLKEFPTKFIHSRPRLCLLYAWILLISGRRESVEPWLIATQVSADQDEAIAGEVAAIRSLLAVLNGNCEQAVALGKKALEKLPTPDIELRGVIALNLGLAYDDLGEYEEAALSYTEASLFGAQSQNLVIAITALSQMADLKTIQGDLYAAADLYQKAIQLAEQPGQNLSIVAISYLRLGRLYYEWNELETTTQMYQRAIEMGQQWESVDVEITTLIYLVDLHRALGQTGMIAGDIEKIESLLKDQVVSPASIQLVKTCLARQWLLGGQSERATHWAQDYMAQNSQNARAFLSDPADTTLARVLLWQGQLEKAATLLQAKARQAVEASRVGASIEMLVLRSLIYAQNLRASAAIETLRQAILLAEPGGYLRLFIDEGTPLAHLLEQLAQTLSPDDPASAYISRLLIGFSSSIQSTNQADSTGRNLPAVHTPRSGPQISLPVERLNERLDEPLVEPLSGRELEVLRLIASGYTNEEIAARLYIAISTVKTHINNIYNKLRVAGRLQAVNRGREAGLI